MPSINEAVLRAGRHLFMGEGDLRERMGDAARDLCNFDESLTGSNLRPESLGELIEATTRLRTPRSLEEQPPHFRRRRRFSQGTIIDNVDMITGDELGELADLIRMLYNEVSEYSAVEHFQRWGPVSV